MEILYDDGPCPHPESGSVVTIGAYDGVHLGHQAVIAEVRRRIGIPVRYSPRQHNEVSSTDSFRHFASLDRHVVHTDLAGTDNRAVGGTRHHTCLPLLRRVPRRRSLALGLALRVGDLGRHGGRYSSG